MQQRDDTFKQEMFYNGCSDDHYVNIVFVPSGLVIAFSINAPGAMHDSRIEEWSGMYD